MPAVLIFGMMYFDQSHKLREEELIMNARDAFEKRSNTEATLALVSMEAKNIPEIDGLLVINSNMVRAHHTIVGVPVDVDNKLINFPD